jgi:hypothetical protein
MKIDFPYETFSSNGIDRLEIAINLVGKFNVRRLSLLADCQTG